MGAMQHTANLSAPDRPARQGDFTRVVHVSPRYFETMRASRCWPAARSPPIATAHASP
jgi:hypothetical protein